MLTVVHALRVSRFGSSSKDPTAAKHSSTDLNVRLRAVVFLAIANLGIGPFSRRRNWKTRHPVVKLKGVLRHDRNKTDFFLNWKVLLYFMDASLESTPSLDTKAANVARNLTPLKCERGP